MSLFRSAFYDCLTLFLLSKASFSPKVQICAIQSSVYSNWHPGTPFPATKVDSDPLSLPVGTWAHWARPKITAINLPLHKKEAYGGGKARQTTQACEAHFFPPLVTEKPHRSTTQTRPSCDCLVWSKPHAAIPALWRCQTPSGSWTSIICSSSSLLC